MKASVVMPVKNEASCIASVIEALFQQSRPPEEVVITDGGSKDSTKDIIKSYISRGLPIKLIEEGRSYPGEGRNIAIKNSSYDLIAMLDAGLVIGHDWLKELLMPLEQDSTIDGVYGNYYFKPVSLNEKALVISYFFAGHKHIKSFSDGRVSVYPSSESLAIRKEVFIKTGGFDVNLATGEDFIYFKKLRKLNMAVSENASVFRPLPVHNLKEAFKRSYLNARYFMLAKHRGLILRSLIFFPIYIIGLALTVLAYYVNILLMVVWVMVFFLLRVLPKVNIAIKTGFVKNKLPLALILLTGMYIFFSDIAYMAGYSVGLIKLVVKPKL